MKCLGSFKDDRICELCAIANPTEHNECEQIVHERHVQIKRLDAIARSCPHRFRELDSDNDEYMACRLKPDGRYHHACRPAEDCKLKKGVNYVDSSH